MYLIREEHLLFRTIIKAFSGDYKTTQNWFITGDGIEAIEKLLLLLQGRIAFTQANLNELESAFFNFPYKTTFISYKEGIAGKNATYYQQRYHATEVGEIITLKQYLFGDQIAFKIVHDYYELLELFHLKHLLNEEVIKLSNGETRKASIFKALLSAPQVLILENPLAGIDQKSIPDLHNLFRKLSQNGLGFIVFGSQEPPDWITHVLNISSYQEVSSINRKDYIKSLKESVTVLNLQTLTKPETFEFHGPNVVKLNEVSVVYGEKKVLDKINWEIKPREKWLLKGENGAGKSTLLSLIYADHPQSYSNDIEIFGNQRGSGESIWDIKEKFAFYSPELHLYFDKSVTCHGAILSGIYFHPFKKGIKYPQREQFARKLFLLFFPEKLLNSPLNQLSTVNQRLILFIRALSQNAPLVLLDEPFQGFDHLLTNKCKQLTDFCCIDKTLVFVSHNPDDIPLSIEKVYNLNNGNGIASRFKRQ
jgi:molybdate transport system ATP-binding protein